MDTQSALRVGRPSEEVRNAECLTELLDALEVWYQTLVPQWNMSLWWHDDERRAFLRMIPTGQPGKCEAPGVITDESALGQLLRSIDPGEDPRLGVSTTPGWSTSMYLSHQLEPDTRLVFEIKGGGNEDRELPVRALEHLGAASSKEISRVRIASRGYVLRALVSTPPKNSSLSAMLTDVAHKLLRVFGGDACSISPIAWLSAEMDGSQMTYTVVGLESIYESVRQLIPIALQAAGAGQLSVRGSSAELFSDATAAYAAGELGVYSSPSGSFLCSSIPVSHAVAEPRTTPAAVIAVLREPYRAPFSPEDQDLLEFASEVLAVSIDRWSTVHEMRHEIDLEHSLASLIEAVYAAESSYDSVLTVVVKEAIKLFGGVAAGLLLMSEDSSELRMAKSIGYRAKGNAEIFLPLDKGLCGYAVRDKTTVASADVTTDNRYFEVLPEIRSEICSPIIFHDDCVGVITVASDHTNWFRQEDSKTISILEMFAKQIAIAMNRAKLLDERQAWQQHLVRTTQIITASTIASGLTHELKNGLVAISTLAQNISPDPSIKARTETLDRISRMRSECDKLTELAIRLGDLSRAGEPHKKPAYLNEVIRDRIRILEELATAKSVKLVVQFDPVLDPPVSGVGHPVLVDRGQIEQVLTNLVLNAIDASHRNQRIDVETRNISPDSVAFSVRDFGGGIPTEAKRRMFDMFFTTKLHGYGIGLPIVKLLVEQNHNGKIEFDSKPGKGTSFEVRLPKIT